MFILVHKQDIHLREVKICLLVIKQDIITNLVMIIFLWVHQAGYNNTTGR